MKSHRTTQVDMIITSMCAPSLHPAQAGGPSIRESPFRTAGRKNQSTEIRAGVRTAPFPIFCFARNFLFPGKRLTST
jgi:hypothetical protein